ncbi:MAG: PEP-CTERM sorting domain-containing protein [Crocosphaera sp.]|nr:PEP-CTERM sorting domain-containing protein [Crocosphaera sp.]
MTRLFNKFSFFATSTVLSLTVINANPVNAALINYDIEVTIDSGFLAGETYFGSFQFEDSGLIGIDEEFLSVSAISFNFNGTNYTETDGFPEVVFFDGEFLGLSFSTDAKFSFIPGFFDLSEAYFTYDIPGEMNGVGDINYSLVPEPLTILGAMTALGLGSAFKRKLKLSNKRN